MHPPLFPVRYCVFYRRFDKFPMDAPVDVRLPRCVPWTQETDKGPSVRLSGLQVEADPVPAVGPPSLPPAALQSRKR